MNIPHGHKSIFVSGEKVGFDWIGMEMLRQGRLGHLETAPGTDNRLGGNHRDYIMAAGLTSKSLFQDWPRG